MDYFDFEVGENEVHRVQYFDEYGGYCNLIRVDGEVISGSKLIITDRLGEGVVGLLTQRGVPNLKKGDQIHFEVGDEEVHDVKIIFRTYGPLGKIIGARVEIDGEIVKDTEKEKRLKDLEL